MLQLIGFFGAVTIAVMRILGKNCHLNTKMEVVPADITP